MSENFLHVIPGQFTRLALPSPFSGYVFGDLITGTGVSKRTNGGTVGMPLPAGPASQEQWTFIGFTAQATLSLASFGNPRGTFGILGDLWLGLVQDSPLINVAPDPTAGNAFQPAQFPADISTFSKIWSGKDDDIRFGTGDSDPELVVNTANFPLPVTVKPGAQMGMVAVLTPSLISVPAGVLFGLGIRTLSWSLLYTK